MVRGRAFASARTSGPHMPAQCRLPTRPSRKALQGSMSLRFGRGGWEGDDHLFEEVIMPRGAPLHANLPKAAEHCTGVDTLEPRRIDGQGKMKIERGIGGAVEM